jgi:cephalosporin-C deacetylase-like acetyl esterase
MMGNRMAHTPIGLDPGKWVVAAMLFASTALVSGQAQISPRDQLVFTPYHQTGIYDIGEKAGWTVTRTADTTCLHYSYTVKENNFLLVKSGDLDLTSGTATIEVQLNEPAMILVNINAECALPPSAAADVAREDKPTEILKPTLLGAAIAPQLLKPSEETPSDFDAFWKANLEKLAKIPINPQLTPMTTEKPGIEMYTVKLDSVDSHVQGYLAKPSRPGKYPAMILYQYAGVYKLNPDNAAHYAQQGWLTFNVDSHDMLPSDDSGASKDYASINNDDRDKSYFLDMFLRDTRAVDFIASLPEWDGKNIALTGSSMGGWQSLVTAGLNPSRITAIAVNVPAGADMNGSLHGRKTGYPNWKMDDANVVKTSPYFDPVNFAPRIKAATLVAMGFIDTTSPPAGVWSLYNQITAPKAVVPLVNAGHDNFSPPEKFLPYQQRATEMFNQILEGQPISFE